ncbi:PRC-barrel domain containing protein [Haladaptatus halobius]|uniref:PRC-barrel domain containing protein n=1 Tax=Haladaptatus halobius TaxID=2884875 RepID=UPI003F5EA535
MTDDDEGKRVINQNGDEIGVVAEVREDTAYIDPDPGMFESIKDKLGWGDIDEDTYPLQDENIEQVTNDEIRLQRL